VQFDVGFNLDFCPLIDGKNCSVIDGGQRQFSETLVAEASEIDGGSASLSKEFVLKRIYGAEYDLVLGVAISNDFPPSKNYLVSVSINPPREDGAFLPDIANTLISVPDISAFSTFALSGPVKVQLMANGPELLLQPRVWISNMKILE
jgi:hypothetical protein